MHRIPSKSKSDNKGPVLIMHGLLGSSADFVMTGPGKALAYVLADGGYDVWLGNSRGNTYSKNNTFIQTDWSEFWDYSWHDIGTDDLPTMIDYILEETSTESIYFIGYPQGTTAFYVMGSERPEYNQKIKVMISLAPLAFVSNLYCGSMKLVSIGGDMFKVVTNILGATEFQPPGNVMLGQVFCNFQAHTRAVCGKFRKFDFGGENEFEYGSDKVPEYSLEKVTVPIALIYSPNDCMSAVKDVEKLSENLPNVIMKYQVPRKFTHLDYVYGKEAKKFVYEKIIEILSKY
ncbi:Lipase 3 [Blattella germanica]|nr:Lipase 3 [Blattella germanica]